MQKSNLERNHPRTGW